MRTTLGGTSMSSHPYMRSPGEDGQTNIYLYISATQLLVLLVIYTGAHVPFMSYDLQHLCRAIYWAASQILRK